jgi:hypothetical protein
VDGFGGCVVAVSGGGPTHTTGRRCFVVVAEIDLFWRLDTSLSLAYIQHTTAAPQHAGPALSSNRIVFSVVLGATNEQEVASVVDTCGSERY